jgi:hypothetical protein
MLNELDPSKSRSMPWRVEEAYAAELELERARWKAISAFVELLSEDERLAPGYYLDPDWSVKDLVAHLGAWMLKARSHLVDIAARSYVPHEIDIEGLNAAALAVTKAEPWDRVWAQTTGARAWMLEAWLGLREPDEALLPRSGLEREGPDRPSGKGQDEPGVGVNVAQQGVDRHARPGRIDLRPLGLAVDVRRDRFGGQGPKLLPRPRPGFGQPLAQFESPVLEADDRRRSGRQHGEVIRRVLTRGRRLAGTSA